MVKIFPKVTSYESTILNGPWPYMQMTIFTHTIVEINSFHKFSFLFIRLVFLYNAQRVFFENYLEMKEVLFKQ